MASKKTPGTAGDYVLADSTTGGHYEKTATGWDFVPNGGGPRVPLERVSKTSK